jgi:hypothetical protein
MPTGSDGHAGYVDRGRVAPLAIRADRAPVRGERSPHSRELRLQRLAGNTAVTRAIAAACLQDDVQFAEMTSAPVKRSAVHGVLVSPGHALQSGLRRQMEAALEADFSSVRVHTGSAAQRSAAGGSERLAKPREADVERGGGGPRAAPAHRGLRRSASPRPRTTTTSSRQRTDCPATVAGARGCTCGASLTHE